MHDAASCENSSKVLRRDPGSFLKALLFKSTRSDAIAAFACMVGALILARAVSDESLSRRILKAAAKRVGKVAKVRAASDRGSQADSRTSQRLRGARGTDR